MGLYPSLTELLEHQVPTAPIITKDNWRDLHLEGQLKTTRVVFTTLAIIAGILAVGCYAGAIASLAIDNEVLFVSICVGLFFPLAMGFTLTPAFFCGVAMNAKPGNYYLPTTEWKAIEQTLKNETLPEIYKLFYSQTYVAWMWSDEQARGLTDVVRKGFLTTTQANELVQLIADQDAANKDDIETQNGLEAKLRLWQKAFKLNTDCND